MASEPRDLEQAFSDYADKGNDITSVNTVKFMKNAKLFGKNCTSNSVDIAFTKVKTDKKKKNINLKEFKALIKEMSAAYGKDHKMTPEEAEIKMTEELSATKYIAQGTKTSKTGGVSKMTDTSQYTGAHKERFDESGKGKGAAGRSDIVANDGYVGNYKGKDTYDKK